jgi:CDP-ribitol ribitolphosphotransferase
MDEFLDADNQEAGRRRAREVLGEPGSRQLILYAPTFRGDTAAMAHFPMEMLDVAALDALAAEIDATVVVKMHPFVRDRLPASHESRGRIIDISDTALDVNDVLLVADLLVTDYSSLIFEFAALDRPMLFYAFDLEEYVASRDFYERYDEFTPGKIVRTFDQLLAAIRAEDFDRELVAPFARRHLPAEPGSATDRIIDQLVMAP